ncbi:MAG TPA: carbohydrate-binding family 9-like protein [Thermoanaerobaculia bacterium]|nr:carbohydrate-binding family 9-like protein [Thermoanaerobaculia bacterium]
MRRAADGGAPRLSTSLVLYHDVECLTALFLGQDDGVQATYWRHDEPLWKEDVVELFLAPERLTRYFEIEVNPLGTTFDAVVDSPDLDRATMRADLGWTCEGLFTAVRTTPSSLDVVVRVPFASLGAKPEGEWRANFFRIDRGSADEYSAWQPTMKMPPDFHVPRAFGGLHFA